VRAFPGVRIQNWSSPCRSELTLSRPGPPASAG
jgi:hypothetical protein